LIILVARAGGIVLLLYIVVFPLYAYGC